MDHAMGNQHMGMVPFMALNLLTKNGLAGEVKHLYAHDVEAFMWVLLCISLHYEKDQSLKVDMVGCGAKKLSLLVDGRGITSPCSFSS
ncbi:hypothetical protein JVU11DRAFT_7026 [Chiua virens]|nr:hypothetical protein JVU11DRAFT_7026 [Chiua virens]